MHYLCHDPECVGNDLPAGELGSRECCYCGASLTSPDGMVLAQGPAPLVDSEIPDGFDALMDGLRRAGSEVRVVQLSAVPLGEGRLLVSSLADDGELLSAELCEGSRAEEVAHLMALLSDGIP